MCVTHKQRVELAAKLLDAISYFWKDKPLVVQVELQSAFILLVYGIMIEVFGPENEENN